MTRKFSELVPQVSFADSPEHTIEWDPEASVEKAEGRNGDYDVVAVKENGKMTNLPLGSARLTRKLIALGPGKKLLKVTRSGEGFNTQYDVKILKGEKP